jgi:hypothetical protein
MIKEEEFLETKRQLLKKIIELQKEMILKNTEIELLIKQLQELDKNE